MLIYGFQKLTLLDFPGHVACIAFTAGCNFRCPFCHNASLVTSLSQGTPVDAAEIYAYLEKRRGMLDGLVLTGGEPLLQHGVAEFLRGVRERGYAVKLDTNGSYPAHLSSLLEQGLLDYVAMDIKNTPEKYALTTGLESIDLDAISQSMEILRQSGVPYEFRTTVTAQTHTVEDIARIAAWIQGAPRYFLQNFKDSGDIIGEGLSGVDADTLARMVEAARKAGLDANAR